MIRVLITGANGFLANYLANLFSDSNSYLVGLARSMNMELDEKYDCIYTDVDTLLTNEIKFDFVFHLASYIPSETSNESNKEFIETNIELTSRLVMAYWSSRFVFASSISVYGVPQLSTLTVDSYFNKPGLYGLSKLAGEAIVFNHPDHAIIRFSSIIGKHMKGHTFIPKILDQARSGTITLWGDGSRKQNYIDVRDAAKLMVKCSLFKGNTLTLGVGIRSYSNAEVAQLVAKKNNSQIKYQGVDASPSFIYDAEDSYKKLAFYPEFTLEQSISHMMNQSQ